MAYVRSFFSFAVLAMTFVSHCWAVNVPGDYDTIQAAIIALENNSTPGGIIEVARGEYSENLMLSGVATIVIKGEETAATFLDAKDRDKPIFSISNASNVTVRNFTFRTGSRGVVLTNSSDIIIASNIFRLGNNGDAISSDALTGVNIINNTFYDNNRAVDRGAEITEITNNIFNNNNVAISPNTLTGAVSYNCFNDNNANGVPGTQVVTDSPPLFVDINLNDFHLKENSPCIDAGNGTDIIDSSTADMGAYGGSYADKFPFKVQNVAVNDDSGNSADTFSISVTWSANESHRVTHTTNPGGYKLYYGFNQSGLPYDGTDASEGISPIDVGNVTSYTISGLTQPNIIPVAPIISNVIPSKSQTLDISWGSVAPATGYRLYYGVNDHNDNQIDVGTVTNYRLSGLTNGVIYNVAVSALHQATYYLSVTAYDNTLTLSHESGYSDERSLDMGNEKESALSAILPGIPEAVVPFPLLPDEGCFIATAAFGYYDAPQVQLLRDFRDHYLLGHSPGRWFVKQYYTHGSKAARYIERHPEWKSTVRLALLPLVAMAWVLFNASWLVQVAVVSGGIMLGALYLRRKKRKLAVISHAREIFS